MTPAIGPDPVIGLVAIGRNEGARLVACLEAARALADAGLLGPMVYVDSGSTDGSPARAEALGVQVVHLDTAQGFTAGRARNAGAAALAALPAPPALIQFIDGDCTLQPGWLETGRAALLADPGLCAVAGRRRERFPDASPFNRLCDMEWNTPTGPAAAVGGDALYRADAFHAVEGFDPAFICGEEPELNRRLRGCGWRLARLDAEMTLHDAAMTRWGQWWKRTERTGWSYAEGAAAYGSEPDRYNRRPLARLRFWGMAVPAGILAALILALLVPGLGPWGLAAALLALLAYPAMALRIARHRRAAFGDPPAHARLYGALTMLGKPAEAMGALRFARAHARGERGRIIEYKGAPAPEAAPESPMSASPPSPVAYLTGEHPRVSHTFIQREMDALRALGVEVLPCSIRRAGADQLLGEAERAEAARTFHVIETARSPARLLRAHASVLAAAPRRWLSALGLAIRTRPPGPKAFLYQLFYFLEAGVLAAHLRGAGARRLHNHFGDSSCTVTMLAAELADIPFGFTMHGPTLFYEPYRWRLDVKIARADFVACISHFCRSQGMLFSDPAHWGKLRLVHCGVDPALYDAAPPRTDAAAAAPRLLFVGRLARVKGLPMLFEAFARLRETRPALRLRLVGDGPDRAWLEARAAALGLTDAVEFAGYQTPDQVAGHMEEADIFVLPSFAEGVPVVLMEALASRRPVVASAVAGVGELVETGVSGLTVPPGDVPALTEAIATLLDDPALRARMGEAGRARVAADYDSAREAAWLKALMQGGAAGVLPEGLRPSAD